MKINREFFLSLVINTIIILKKKEKKKKEEAKTTTIRSGTQGTYCRHKKSDASSTNEGDALKNQCISKNLISSLRWMDAVPKHIRSGIWASS